MKIRKYAKTIGYLFAILLVAIIIRTFFFEIVRVPSASMENTILTGDVMLVEKISCGARFMNKEEVYRSPKFGEIHVGDVVVFNIPIGDTVIENVNNYYEYKKTVGEENLRNNPEGYGYRNYLHINNREQYVKRCVGTPGDTVMIRQNVIFIDSKRFIEHKNFIQQKELKVPIMRDWNYQRSQPKEKRVYSQIFPNDFSNYWSESYFGPLWIPKKGATVTLDSVNISLYQRIITAYEHNTLQETDTAFIINGKPETTYTFKQNYYFVMGDNRAHSFDSRNWGFVPEDHIKGKAIMILCSFGEKAGQWKRIFKLLD